MRKRGKQFNKRRDPMAHLLALDNVQPLDQSRRTDAAIAYWLAFDSLCNGTGIEKDAHTLSCSINIALVLAEQGYGADWIEQIKDAQLGLMRCIDRGQRTKRWGLDGQAIAALSESLSLHDEQIKVVTQKQIINAISEITKRAANGDVFEMESA